MTDDWLRELEYGTERELEKAQLELKLIELKVGEGCSRVMCSLLQRVRAYCDRENVRVGVYVLSLWFHELAYGTERDLGRHSWS